MTKDISDDNQYMIYKMNMHGHQLIVVFLKKIQIGCQFLV